MSRYFSICRRLSRFLFGNIPCIAVVSLALFLCVAPQPARAGQASQCEITWQAFRLPSSVTQTPAPSSAFIPTAHAPLLSSSSDIAGAQATASRTSDPDTATERDFILAITLTPPPGVYIYGTKTRVGLPTSVEAIAFHADAAAKGSALAVRPPVAEPKRKTVFAASGQPGMNDAAALIYPGPAVFLTQAAVKDGRVRILVRASGLLCSATSCTPFSQELPLTLSREEINAFPRTDAQAWWPVWSRGQGVTHAVAVSGKNATAATAEATDAVMVPVDMQPLFASLAPRYFSPELEVDQLGGALFFGLIAGLLLNLMPCVLPVVSLKFSALMAVSAMTDKQAQARAFRLYCVVFAAGIMTWFMILALLFGQAGLAWGEMFQNPLVITILALVLFLLGLSLFGVFSLPVVDLKVSSPSHPHWQAFASGMLATLLATPCSGPLLGGVLGWALRQPVPVMTLCIASVGIGMSLPYGILAFFPGLVHLLPRPGNWIIRLEQLLGFCLMGSVVYLVTLLPAEWIPAFLMNIFAVALAAWLWGQIGHLRAGRLRRALSRIAAVAAIVLAFWWGRTTLQEDFSWEPFDPAVFSEALGKEPMLVEFTADWCPSCKALEHTTLNKTRMALLRERYSMRTIKVDLTRDDAVGKEFLKALGSVSIPVVALFPEGPEAKKPVVLRDIVTPSQLKEALSDVF